MKKDRMLMPLVTAAFVSAGLFMPAVLFTWEDRHLTRQTEAYAIESLQLDIENQANVILMLELAQRGYFGISVDTARRLSEDRALAAAKKEIGVFVEQGLTDLSVEDIIAEEAVPLLAVAYRLEDLSGVLWQCRLSDSHGRKFQIIVDDASSKLVAIEGIPAKTEKESQLSQTGIQWADALANYYGFSSVDTLEGYRTVEKNTDAEIEAGTLRLRYILSFPGNRSTGTDAPLKLSFSIEGNRIFFNNDGIWML